MTTMTTDPAITWAQSIAEALGHWCASAIAEDWQQCQSLAELNARWYVASVDEERRLEATLPHDDPRRPFLGGVRHWEYSREPLPEGYAVERLRWTTATGRLTVDIERGPLGDAHCEIDIWAGPAPGGQPRLVAAVHLATGHSPTGEINDMSLIDGREDRLDLLLRLAGPLGFDAGDPQLAELLRLARIARMPQEEQPYELVSEQSW